MLLSSEDMVQNNGNSLNDDIVKYVYQAVYYTYQFYINYTLPNSNRCIKMVLLQDFPTNTTTMVGTKFTVLIYIIHINIIQSFT